MFIRAKKNQNYSVINNTCFRDPNLSARAKGIFAYIMTLPDNWEMKKYELVKHFSEGKQSFSTAFKELENAGYIEKTPSKGSKGQFKGWDYVVHEVPSKTEFKKDEETDCPETDISEHRYTANPEEIISTDNTLSTKKVNTDNNNISDDSINVIYEAYPRKVGKVKAFKAIKKALAKISIDELLSKVVMYADIRSKEDPKFTPHPSTWFNEERWNDINEINGVKYEQEELFSWM